MQIRKDFKYKVVDSFLSKEETELMAKYARLRHLNNNEDFDLKTDANGDSAFYDDPLMTVTMDSKLELMEKETGLKLLPTYAFWRMYTHGAVLWKHTDRPSCEISVTVMIGSDGTSWPIYVDKGKVELKPGQAVIYLGCELEHWRDPFEGDWHAQTFFHYVDANGPNKDWKFDKKSFLGEKKNNGL